jgi:hypothetical protein
MTSNLFANLAAIFSIAQGYMKVKFLGHIADLWVKKSLFLGFAGCEY